MTLDNPTQDALPDPTGTALISNAVLYDVNLLLNINVFSVEPAPEYLIPAKPSPWEVAYIFIRLATYMQALVFFDKVVYINEPHALKTPLHDHLDSFTRDNPMQPLFGGRRPSVAADERYHELIRLVQHTFFRRKGFQELFRDSSACKDSMDFAAPFVAHYYYGTQLPFDYFANPFESSFVCYDVVKSNLAHSHEDDARNVALHEAMSFVEESRDPGSRGNRDLSRPFSVAFPPVFVAALMEAHDLESMFQVVFQLRKEARKFRKAMRRLDDSGASATEIRAKLEELRETGLGVIGQLLDYASVGPSLFFISFGIPLSKLLRRWKKTFLEKMSHTALRHRQVAGKIGEVLRNSGYEVDGDEVLAAATQFLDEE